MTIEKCRFLLNLYAVAINEKNVHRSESAHLMSMIQRMHAMLDEIERLENSEDDWNDADLDRCHAQREKFMRWLGFMQGSFWMMGVYTIDQMKAHNRPDPIALGQDWVTKVTSEDE